MYVIVRAINLIRHLTPDMVNGNSCKLQIRKYETLKFERFKIYEF
jgi:hypothetical protein